LNAKHYSEVLNIRSNIDQLKKSDDRLAMQIAALKPVEHALRKEFGPEIRAQQAKIQHPSANMIGMAVQDPLLFASGSADISNRGRRILARLASALKTAPDMAMIRIIGHTDPVPLNQSLKIRFIDNWGLSTARAAAVARRLIWDGHLDARRMRIEGRSKYDPVAANNSPARMARNRRVEVFVELAK